MNHDSAPEEHAPVEHQRWELLAEIDDLIDKPLIFLSFVWLLLLILEFTVGLSEFLQRVSLVIWGLFAVDFILGFTIAPAKRLYFRRNWITAVSLVLPAFRIVRAFSALRALRLFRVTRTVGLVRLLTSANRGIRAVKRTFARRRFGYVAALTVLVTLIGAAGMTYFESPSSIGEASATADQGAVTGIESYSEGIWWTTGVMTTMGFEHSPRTAEGRILAFLLAIYALGVFGYVTGTIATHFLAQDAATATDRPPEAGLIESVAALQAEVRALRAELAQTRTGSQPPHQPGSPQG